MERKWKITVEEMVNGSKNVFNFEHMIFDSHYDKEKGEVIEIVLYNNATEEMHSLIRFALYAMEKAAKLWAPKQNKKTGEKDESTDI